MAIWAVFLKNKQIKIYKTQGKIEIFIKFSQQIFKT